MKENATALYPSHEAAEIVSSYAYEHSTNLPPHILEYHAEVADREDSYYMISPLQAQYHIWFARSIGAKRILEIGTYVGFSALGWSQAAGTEGGVTTLEFSPMYAKIAREMFEKYHVENINVIVGDANETLRNVAEETTEPYDLIFIDADKVSYPAYLSTILSCSTPSSPTPRLLKAGGVIIADNVLRRGLVADSSEANPSSAQARKSWKEEDIEALRRFNDDMVKDVRLETFMMPLFDGLGMARLRD